jgi:hypothetical protein
LFLLVGVHSLQNHRKRLQEKREWISEKRINLRVAGRERESKRKTPVPFEDEIGLGN